MDALPFDLRDVVLLLAALAAIYLVFVATKLFRMGRHTRSVRKSPTELATTTEPQIAVATNPDARNPPVPAESFVVASGQESEVNVAPPSVSVRQAVAAYGGTEHFQQQAVSPIPAFEWEEVKSLFRETDDPPSQTPTSSTSTVEASHRPGGFGEHIGEHLVRTDMEMEIQRMRDEMQQMREELEELRAARRVSPQYAEAMELVQRGMPTQDVADRLGISLAEAELVQALSRGRQEFD